ncbi:MAG: ABC transporter permease [Clostridiaceae bacterium]|nr:ABC transporter permease [Eubacteriales bacterium]
MGLRYKNPKLERLEESMDEMLRESLTERELFSFASFDAAAVERTGYSNYSYWRSTFKVFGKNRVAMFLVIVVAVILLFTFVQPVLPNQRDAFTVNNNPLTGLFYKNVPPGKVTEAGDSFLLGTNQIGQDLWAQLWEATRTSLFISTTVALIEAFVGILVGVLWGYVRKLDFVFTEIYNVLDNIPVTIILILVAYIMRPGILTMIVAMSLTSWIGMARFVRNQILVIRDREYNLASRCLGTNIFRIITKNLLPYIISVIMLRFALAIPANIGYEVFVTYIGLGLPATMPSLGNLVNEGRKLVLTPGLGYQLIYPTIILSIVTISFYVVGNAFSDAADPKNHV